MKSQKAVVKMKAEAGTARTGKLLKIGEVAALSGVGIETLRFYERANLLERPSRTEGGYRLYEADVVERLAFIKRAQVLGLSLDEIAHLIAERRAGRSPCNEVRAIVAQRLSELDERLAQMRRYRRELGALLQEWATSDGESGQICGLIENADLHAARSEQHELKEARRKK